MFWLQAPSQSAPTILKNRAPCFLKNGAPCFLQKAGWKKQGHSLFKKRRDQAASSLFELQWPWFFALCFFQKAGCLIFKHEYFRACLVMFTAPNWHTLGIMVITQFNHIIAFFWIKRQFYRGKVNKISSTACWLLKLFVTFTLFMYEIVKIVDVTKSCSCCLTNQD